MLDTKVTNAKLLILSNIRNNPIIMSSFGKDSMVLLDLVKKCDLKPPILFFREPFCPQKYEFANKIILDNHYIVYDYPPVDTAISKRGNTIEVINYHQISANPLRTIYMPTGILPPNGNKEYLCGLRDIFEKPRCIYNFKWNTIFIGHKSTDKDPILGGTVELLVDQFIDKQSNKEFIFPLRHFTDEDIWTYTTRENIPINHRRYNKDNNWKEFEDITYNPDYFYACTKCIDRDNSDEVLCPKVNYNIPNISDSIPYINADLSHYTQVKSMEEN